VLNVNFLSVSGGVLTTHGSICAAKTVFRLRLMRGLCILPCLPDYVKSAPDFTGYFRRAILA